MQRTTYTDLVLDLGGVAISYSTKTNTALLPRTIKQIFGSTYWHDYERGRLSSQECNDSITKAFCLAPGTWSQALAQMESTLTPHVELIDAVKGLKAMYPHLRVHAFSNISAPDYKKIERTVNGWGIFDSITTSASIGCRKPEFDSYRQLLQSANMEAHKSIFVDDLPENVINAQCLGFRGVLFRDQKAVVAQLHNILGDPVERGMKFLQQNSKNLFTETDSGVIVKDNFCQLLILQCTGDRFGPLALMIKQW